MDGLALDEDAFKSIARLPSRDVLNGQLAGVVASPITGVVRGLNALISGLAVQLGAIAEQGLVAGGEEASDEGSGASAAGPVAEDGPPADSPEDASSTPPAEDESEEEGSDGSDETSNEQTEQEE